MRWGGEGPLARRRGSPWYVTSMCRIGETIVRTSILWGIVVCLVGCQLRPYGAEKNDAWWTPVLDRCGKGDDDACRQLQQEGLRALPGTKLDAVGRRAAMIACERDDASSCSLLVALSRTPTAKRAALERACRLGEADDCAKLWRAHAFGDPLLKIEPDVDAALPWAERTCLVDPKVYGSYCDQHVHALVDAPEKVKSDEQVEHALSLSHCKPKGLSAADCDIVLASLRMGPHPRYPDAFINRRRAEKLAGTRCAQGRRDACYLVGLLRFGPFEEKRDPAAALEIWDPACAGGHKPSCLMAARLRLVRGPNYELDAALEGFRKGCGKDLDCHARTARILAHKRLLPTSIPFFTTACEGGLSWACADLGRVLVLLGRPIDDHEEALTVACDRGSKESCLAVASAYDRGLGVKRQPQLAKKYRKRAHDLRLSTRYWESMRRAVDGTGSELDSLNAMGSLASLLPMVMAGVASAADIPWDFSEVTYDDP
jgi:TPR repeat protein